MITQQASIQPVIDVIGVSVDPVSFGNLVQVSVQSNAANQVVQGVNRDVVGLTIANLQASAYVSAASLLLAAIDVNALHVMPTDRPTIQKRVDELNRNFKLLSDSVNLSTLLLAGGNRTSGVVAGPLRPPGTADTTNATAFLAYLDSQFAAAKALSSDDTLPGEKFLDDLTRSWEVAIRGSFPNDKRSREQQVAESCVFQDRLDDTIGILNEVVGDRDLLNPAIL
jgi:hypothetical protein